MKQFVLRGGEWIPMSVGDVAGDAQLAGKEQSEAGRHWSFLFMFASLAKRTNKK